MDLDVGAAEVLAREVCVGRILLDGVDVRAAVRKPERAVAEARAEFENRSRAGRRGEDSEQRPVRSGVDGTAAPVFLAVPDGRCSDLREAVAFVLVDPRADRLGGARLAQRSPPRSK